MRACKGYFIRGLASTVHCDSFVPVRCDNLNYFRCFARISTEFQVSSIVLKFSKERLKSHDFSQGNKIKAGIKNGASEDSTRMERIEAPIDLKIGGEKGHLEEIVDDPVFLALYSQFRWKMIPNCTGRYTCRDHKIVSLLVPLRLIQSTTNIRDSFEQYQFTFATEKRKDSIIVIPFSDDKRTGLISYIRHDSDNADEMKYVHTLNSPSGFQRKLEAIGVILCDEYRVLTCSQTS